MALASPAENLPDLINLTLETRQVLDALRAAGGRPLIVGGSVRDALLSRTQGTSTSVYGLSREEVRAALPGDVEEFGQSFGVFNTVLNGHDFDLALPRRDNKTGDRPPRVRRRNRPEPAVRSGLRAP